MTTERTMAIVRAYYDSWKGGAAAFDEAKLSELLAPNVAFESPVARRDTAADLVTALARFAKTVKALRFVQLVHEGNEAAAIYDCELTGPVDELRIAEFFRVEGDAIRSIRLAFDATAYRKL
jgi:ketosteroid isomerase-like protein